METNDDIDTPQFRARKKRKILRRPDQETESHSSGKQSMNNADGEEASQAIHGTDGSADDLTPASTVQKVARRSAIARTRGVAFNNQSESLTSRHVPPDSTVAVIENQSSTGLPIETNRFAKATGRSGVVEDKHLYVHTHWHYPFVICLLVLTT